MYRTIGTSESKESPSFERRIPRDRTHLLLFNLLSPQMDNFKLKHLLLTNLMNLKLFQINKLQNKSQIQSSSHRSILRGGLRGQVFILSRRVRLRRFRQNISHPSNSINSDILAKKEFTGTPHLTEAHFTSFIHYETQCPNSTNPSTRCLLSYLL